MPEFLRQGRQTIVFTARQRAALTLGSKLRRPTIYSSAISRRFSEVSETWMFVLRAYLVLMVLLVVYHVVMLAR
jgi:hypothetical protein